MNDHSLFNKIDLHLIRVLYTVLSERSVSKAATKLGMYQPAVSACLKRLRDVSGDPLLVRSGLGLVPTEVALRMVEPAGDILRAAETLFAEARVFQPSTTTTTFKIAASDYLDPFFLPQVVALAKLRAPHCHIEIYPLSAAFDYRSQLAHGGIDVVLGNWTKPPDDLHLGRLFEDEVVCLVSSKHPAIKRGWDINAWLQADHVAPSAIYLGAKGVIDDHLESLGLARNITTRCPYFGLIPEIVASTLLVLTTGRQYCERFVHKLPVEIVSCPVKFPQMYYYQLWHERTHTAKSSVWLRDIIKLIAADLTKNKITNCHDHTSAPS